MKRDTKKRAALFTFYALFVILLLLGTRCESRPHLTTPERDAKHLAELASTIRTEAELRAVEKIASEYEIAYRKSYGGATALYFKSLYEPIMDEAGERRAAFRNEEEYIDQINTTLSTTLEDLELAWSMSLGTEEEERAKLEANNLIIEEYNDERDVLVEANDEGKMLVEVVNGVVDCDADMLDAGATADNKFEGARYHYTPALGGIMYTYKMSPMPECVLKLNESKINGWFQIQSV